eukprot:1083599-Prymnesium_polylepis.1
MAVMLLPPRLAFVDTSRAIATMRDLSPPTLHTFFVTCLIAFCLGHRPAGEVEVGTARGKWAADSSSLGSS